MSKKESQGALMDVSIGAKHSESDAKYFGVAATLSSTFLFNGVDDCWAISSGPAHQAPLFVSVSKKKIQTTKRISRCSARLGSIAAARSRPSAGAENEPPATGCLYSPGAAAYPKQTFELPPLL